MPLLTDSGAVRALCGRLAQEDFVTVDTEFIRERTYWPNLCLIQLAGDDEAAAIDALAPDIDLQPVYDLFANPEVVKVFHAARQDIEIFVHKCGTVPAPVFDTQLAAMVCGFGDQVGYETLVRKVARESLDKSSRFTDWALRPLTEKQLFYALADVTHLRVIYRKLRARIEENGRLGWLDEEMAVLSDPATYVTDPRDAWTRLKIRSTKPRFLNIVRELAAWREEAAQKRNMPRNHILRDEALLEIAAHAPELAGQLARTRGLARQVAEGRIGAEILATVKRAAALPLDSNPEMAQERDLPRGLGPTVDLLKVLLKMRCESNDVAQKLVANTADLELIAADDDADVPALRGWRRALFGDDALALKHGRLALTIEGRKLSAIELEDGEDDQRREAG